MGFFKKLFSGDPRQDLERAREWMDKGEPDRALDLAQRAARNAVGADQERAAKMVAEAQAALAAKAIERASQSLESEYFDDAAEWLRGALEYVEAPEQRRELEARLRSIEIRAREAEDAAYELPDHESDVESVTLLDPETHYQALLGMLRDEVADRYEDLPAAFRNAYVDLNEGEHESALAALDALVADGDDRPAIVLERGRCRLLLGEYASAVGDFEAVWETFGDEPLDFNRERSVPALWAEAKLALEEPQAVLDRLGELGDPSSDRPSLSAVMGRALIAIDDPEGARRLLARAASRFPRRADLSYLLASALARSEDPVAAIDCLEIAIAPSCASGNCAKPPKHLPSLRLLAGLYLMQEGSEERVQQLLTLITSELGGRLTHEDYGLLARHHQQVGEPEAAEQAAAEAQRLREQPETAPKPGALNLPRGLGPAKRAAL
ncbi:MAG: tetratricopeptide repeat protein [Acidobacteriota bacterium]